jgi:small subunit ribosomal protein S12
LPSSTGFQQNRTLISLIEMHRRGPPKKKKKISPLGGKPFAKGVVIKTVIRKPKKPNSANRKCVMVRLSGGKEMIAYVPGN